MNINSALGDLLAPSRAMNAPLQAETQPPTPQALASANQSRAQEALADARETQKRVQAQEQSSEPTANNQAYEQYLRTGRLDTYA